MTILRFTKIKTRCARILLLALYVLAHQPLVGAEPEKAQPATPSSYEQLAQAYLPSLVKEAQTEKLSEAERQQRNAKKVEALTKKAKGAKVALKESDIDIPVVGEIEKLELIYNLMHEHAQACPTLTNNVVHDLEIFCGGPSDLKDHVFGAIDHTTTAFGRVELQRMLLEPKTDAAELRARQDIIKTLIKNPDLVKKIDASLQQIKAAESELLWFWKQMDETTNQFFNQVYFGKTLGISFSGLNTSSSATTAAAMWAEIGSPLWWGVGLPLSLLATASAITTGLVRKNEYDFTQLPEAAREFVRATAADPANLDKNMATAIEKIGGQQMQAAFAALQNSQHGGQEQVMQHFQDYQDVIADQSKDIQDSVKSLGILGVLFRITPSSLSPLVANTIQSPSFLNIYKTLSLASCKGIVELYTKTLPGLYKNQSTSTAAAIIATLYLAIPPAIYLMLIKGSVSSARHFNAISNIIHAKMIKAAFYFDATGELIKIMSTDKALSKMLVDTTAQAKTRSPAQEAQLKELLRLMDTSTLHSNPSFFSLKGRPLAAFKLMQNTKNEFAGVLQLAGKLDAYLSLAKLYCSNPWGRYCFVDYVTNSATPYLKIDDFWHPMLNPNKVVANSIELGATSGARNAVITGPNAGGKSTALKSIVLAIVMAQTLGIAPARAMKLTPFVQTGAYLNIADAIGKESLYQAEMNRAQALLNSINALKPGEFSFVIMDEIFTGTNPEEGSAGAFGIATCLASLPQNMCLIATHYKQLTELEKAADHSFKNYKVSVVIHPDGKITPTYILDAGIADQKIALQLLTNAGFNNKVLQAAKDALNSQKSLPAA
ncbi:MAG: hypothetical protein WCW33_00750 [Candidatus Babeliales bacterium]|jgi:hypothetical protein